MRSLLYYCLSLLLVSNVLESGVGYTVRRSEQIWFELDVVHHNDFHARFEETSLTSPVCRPGEVCMGGFARLYAAIRRLLDARPEALLLNAGDAFQGTFWYTLMRWNVTQKFFNKLPHDAHTLGNHEFDNGVAGLVPYLRHLRGPVVVANIDTSSEPTLQNLYEKHIILCRNGRRIGIIGVITSTTAIGSNAGKVKFMDEREAVRNEAAKLVGQGVNIIIVLSHCGLPMDREIAADYGENVDLIVGGHSHSLLYTGPSPSGEKPEDVYPVVVENNNTGHKVLIVQASAFTKYLGFISVWFNRAGEVQDWQGLPIFLNRSISEDRGMLEQLRPYAEEVHAAQRGVVGNTTVFLNASACYSGECNIGDLVCDAFLDTMSQNVSSDATKPWICLINSGSLRANIPVGPITVGDIYTSLPYGNTVDTFTLSGRYLMQALEHSVSKSWSMTPFVGPHVLQFSGIRAIFNTSSAVGSRVQSARAPTSGESGAPLEDIRPDADYRVVSLSFITRGGDNYTMISANLRQREVGPVDVGAATAFLRLHSPVAPNVDGRNVIVS